jgi:hypothetical protein
MTDRRNSKGTVLLQVLVMSVILATLSAYMLQWFFARYRVVNQTQRRIYARTIAESCYRFKMVAWSNFGTLPSYMAINGIDHCLVSLSGGAGVVNVLINIDTSVSGPPSKLDFIVDYDEVDM